MPTLPTKRQLFDVAVEKAIEERLIASESDADIWESEAEYYYFNLKSKSRTRIARYENTDLIAIVNHKKDIGLIKLSPEEAKEKAAEWAKSVGYTVPTKMNGCLSIVLVVIGLCMWIVPGILILIWIWWQGKDYESEMNKIVGRWNDAGRPKAGQKEAPPLALEQVNQSEESKSLEGKLEELKGLLDKGLISDDEYQAIRRKKLGL
jgi:hypothetical protein